MNPYYTDYAEYIGRFFPNDKIQKISVNAGFSCPNRDGTIGKGGCIYCDNHSFTPAYCFGTKDIKKQLIAGKEFFARKYPRMKFLAYFQSYTNTGQRSTEYLSKIYREALDVDDVVGLIIGTRPDSISEEIIETLVNLGEFGKVFVELGAESSHNKTLDIINRGHNWETTVDAVERLSASGISVGLHLIMGLPEETEDMMFETVRRAIELPIESLKLHHLQILRDTPLMDLYETDKIKVKPFKLEDYVDLCVKIIKLVPRNIAIERFLASSPPEKVYSPKWGLKNYQFTNLLINRLNQSNK